ncbi:hypothetical protein C9374_006355 [Naegleria lovaniensis]|uniref:N-acetylaspartylglutamate synthase n=1 Tax=Naegleria lovaniensis TaxID=51637 RepID=A0AA88KME2_NAELO|nr:uncharacterized protein C9374_006355 [Naegleria lovaniensis]KAG2381366.1 hypothetical protein C9374_006355 [Naegleria lovaniensis]
MINKTAVSLMIAILLIAILCCCSSATFVQATSAAEAATPPTSSSSTSSDHHHHEDESSEQTTISADLSLKDDILQQQNNSGASSNTSSSDETLSNGKTKNKSKRTIQITIPKDYEKFVLKPRVIGEEQKIRIYNAQNTTFYQRKLKNPVLKMWILIVGRKMKNDLPYYTYSAKRFFETAWRRNIQVELMEIQKFDMMVAHDGSNSIMYDGEVIPREEFPDAVLPRLGAHIDYWGLAVVRQLEKLDILVLNGFESLEMTRDKLQTLQQLAKDQIAIPKTMIARFPIDTSIISRHFSFPIILKKSSGSQGKGVLLVQSEDQIKGLGDMLDTTKPMIIQEFIAASKGRDIRAIVLGGKVIGAMMRVAKSGFKSNFHQGGYVKPVKLSNLLEWLAISAAQSVELDFAGVDILIDRDTYKICEINSSPGFEGFELATGVNVPDQLFNYVELKTSIWRKLDKKKKKKKPVLIPVEAEHVVASKPEQKQDIQIDLNGQQL